MAPISLLSLGESEIAKSTFSRASEGSSGFTFLVTSPALHSTTTQKVLNLVLKWENPALADNECETTAAMGVFGFKVPEIKTIEDKKLYKSCSGKAQPLCHAARLDYSSMKLLLMDRLHGANLKQTLENGTFERLPAEDLRRIFFELGQGSVIDVFLGNNDRVLRPNQGLMNSGNIILNIDDGKLVDRIGWIDSTSQLLPTNMANSSEDVVQDLSLDFLLEGHQTESEIKKVLSPPLPKTSSPMPESESFSETRLKLLQEDRATFIHWLFDSIFKEIQRIKSSFTFQNESCLIESLGEGVEKGMALLRDRTIQEQFKSRAPNLHSATRKHYELVSTYALEFFAPNSTTAKSGIEQREPSRYPTPFQSLSASNDSQPDR